MESEEQAIWERKQSLMIQIRCERLTGGNPVRIVLDQNSRSQKKRVMYLTINKTIFLLKRQLIPTRKPYL
jgi:hypothetical protein